MIILRPADAAFGVVGPRGGWSQLVLDPYTSSPSAVVNQPRLFRLPSRVCGKWQIVSSVSANVTEQERSGTELNLMQRNTMDQKWNGARAEVFPCLRNHHYYCLLLRASSGPTPRKFLSKRISSWNLYKYVRNLIFYYIY